MLRKGTAKNGGHDKVRDGAVGTTCDRGWECVVNIPNVLPGYFADQ